MCSSFSSTCLAALLPWPSTAPQTIHRAWTPSFFFVQCLPAVSYQYGCLKEHIVLNLSTASGFSTPPNTPTQSCSQPVFTQETQPSTPVAANPDASPRSHSMSTPPDIGQRLTLPSIKPSIPSSSPVPSHSTSQVSLTAEMSLSFAPTAHQQNL